MRWLEYSTPVGEECTQVTTIGVAISVHVALRCPPCCEQNSHICSIDYVVSVQVAGQEGDDVLSFDAVDHVLATSQKKFFDVALDKDFGAFVNSAARNYVEGAAAVVEPINICVGRCCDCGQSIY